MTTLLLIAATALLVVFAVYIFLDRGYQRTRRKTTRWATYRDEAWWVREDGDAKNQSSCGGGSSGDGGGDGAGGGSI